jgi:hydrogenase nickel incorporation protein HypA/HybF
MHELSIAVNIVEIASEEAKRLDARRVESVHVTVGEFSGVAKEALLFAWEMASQDTAVAGSRLAIEDAPGRELQVTALEIEDGEYDPTSGRGSQECSEAQ